MEGQDTVSVIAAREGDPEAFKAVIESHWTRLVSLARSVVGDLEAEDAVQDGLLHAWNKLGRLRDPSAFGAWVTRIVLRRCFKRARRAKFHIPLEDAPEPQVPEISESRLDVPRLLGALAPRQRAVMHLTIVEGMSDREIGQALGLGAASVRSHRRRAKESLRKLSLEGDG